MPVSDKRRENKPMKTPKIITAAIVRCTGLVRLLREKQCALVGHSFDSIDELLFKIEINALNQDARERAVLKCRRCKATFRAKEQPNAELSDAGGQSASASQKDVARPHSLQ